MTASTDLTVSVRLGPADVRPCRLSRIGVDGVFVRGLYGVVANERVEVILEPSLHPSIVAQGIVRRVVGPVEARERGTQSGISIVWADPSPELLATCDELDEQVDAATEGTTPELDLADALVHRFNEAMRDGRADGALDHATKLRALDPDAVRYQVAYELAIGLISRVAGDVVHAEESFQRALDLDPTCEQAALLLKRKDATESVEDPPTPLTDVTDVPHPRGRRRRSPSGSEGAVRFRAYPRRRVHIPAQMRTSDRMEDAHARDLSEGGAFVPTKWFSPVGSTLLMTLGIPGERQPVHVRARIARVVTDEEASATGAMAGMGVQFLDLSESELLAIRSIVGRPVTVPGAPN